MSNPLITSITTLSKTSAEWLALNPILSLTQAAFSTDTKELRIGNGILAWADLPADNAHGTTPPHGAIHAVGGRDPIHPLDLHAVPLDASDKIDRGYLYIATLTEAGIVQLNNTLTSTSTAIALTAAQGKVLKDLVDTKETSANKNAANGYAGLGADGKILESLLPALAITDTFEAASDVAMTALSSAQKGDICIRSDLNKTFVLSVDGYATLANWKELKTPTDLVLSVAGRTGVVVLTKADVGLSNVDNTSDANKPVSTAQQAALDLKTDKTTTVNGHALDSNVSLTTSDIPSSTDKRYLTDAQVTQVNNTSGINTGNETATSIGNLVNAATIKSTPIDADLFAVFDSVASFITRKISFAQLKAVLKTYFDTLYNKYVHPNHTGDVTSVADGATTIAANVVTNTKLAQVATATLKGRTTAGTGNVEDLTVAQVLSMLGLEAGTTGDMTAAEILALLLTVDGTGSTLDADLLDGLQSNTADTANTIAARDANGDVTVRTPKMTFADQTTVSGGIVFRTNNSTDNGLRVCTNITALRSYLGAEYTGNKNSSNGYAGLDANGKLFEAHLPSLALSDTFESTSEANMLALSTARKGDICIRSDLNKTFILAADGYATLANWKELRTPTGAVLSVNGLVGAISLTTSNIPATTDNRYVTDAQLAIIAATSGTNTGNETTTSIGSMINGATAKVTPVDADMVGLMDSAASNILKKVSWANIKATLKTYFDTLYNYYTHPATHAASMIDQDSTHRMVSDTQITEWDAKQAALGYTPENVANKGVADGYPGLDSFGNIELTKTEPKVVLTDTGYSTRSVLAQQGSIGFLRSVGTWACYADDSGNFTAIGDVTAFSDRRLKDNLEVIPSPTEKLKQLTGYTYDRIDLNQRKAGLIAQDVQKVLPEAVTENGPYLSVCDSAVTALLVETIKDLTARIEILEEQLKNK